MGIVEINHSVLRYILTTQPFEAKNAGGRNLYFIVANEQCFSIILYGRRIDAHRRTSFHGRSLVDRNTGRHGVAFRERKC